MYPQLEGFSLGVEPVPHPGFSGAQLWRILATQPAEELHMPSAMYVLRRWPAEHPSPERLAVVHELLKSVHANGFKIVPVPLPTFNGQTWVCHGGHLWELALWLPGQPDRHLPTPPGRLRAAFEALARFHELSARVHPGHDPDGGRSAPIPAVEERRRLAAAWQEGWQAALADAVAHGPGNMPQALGDLAREVLRLAFPLLPELATRLGAWRAYETPLSPAIRDLHREHVLFTGEQVTGLIDFGALRIDTPLTDVARLLGSLAGDDPTARTCALQAYAARRPLARSDHLLIDLLDQSNVVLGALNWLKWLYLERRQFPSWPAVIRRLEELVTRLGRIKLGRTAATSG